MAMFGGGKDDKGATPEARPAKTAAPGGLSVIGQGMIVRGDVESNGIVKIEGDVVGQVNAAGQVLIARGGKVDGDINTREAIVGGAVRGAITASDRVEIQQGATVEGDITTRRILVAEGGQIDGSIRMGSEAPAAKAVPAAAPGQAGQSVARVTVPPGSHPGA